jgi:hypothetical protein
MSMDCIRSRGIDRLNLSRIFKREYEISEMLSFTSYLCRRHGHHGVPDVMMSLKGAVGGPTIIYCQNMTLNRKINLNQTHKSKRNK